LAFALPAVAHAQSDPAPEIDPSDPAWVLYHSAFSALAKGENDVAKARLEELVRRFPDHPVAVRALETLALLGGSVSIKPDGPEPPDLRHEVKTKSARAELALIQTLHGIAVGVELCIIAECDDGTAFIGTILLGAAAGVGGSLLLTRDGITSGQRATANSGTLWGAWNGAMILGIMVSDSSSDEDVTQATTVLLASQLAGLGLGVAAGQMLKPTDGQVALANTVGIWTGVLTLLAFETFEIDFTDSELLGTLLFATDAALVGGAFLAKKEPMSRGRTLVIDAGGIVGLLAGFGIVTLIQGEDRDPRTFFAAGMAGTAVGLGAATWFTRRWDF
jgi:hypothetical protein